MRKVSLAAFASLALVGLSVAEDSKTAPRPVPLTRPVMKHLLEDMKGRTPRIPLPEPTEEEKARAAERGGNRGFGGGFGYEGRLRSLYGSSDRRNGEGRGQRPAGAAGGNGAFGFGREPDPKSTLDYKFKTQLFWIVSRANNCQYCLGHQEHKLLAAGMKEDELAALDTNWQEFTPAEQAAFAYARKFTYEPHKLSDADIEGLKKHYTDMQILEMTLSMAGNNAINRWKEGAGVPQSKTNGFGRRNADPTAPAAPDTYETPTSEKYASLQSIVAPIHFENGVATTKTVSPRPKLESREEVERMLAAARSRKPRLPLVDEATARAVLPEDWPQGTLPQWVRLLANFPRDGRNRAVSQLSSEETGDLTPLLKAQASWIIARQDRAWYATGLAKKRLEKLGQTQDQIYALDGDWQSFSPKERAMFTVARNLAASPVVLTDDEVTAAVNEAGPRDVVQMINYVTVQASFDRITEAAGLALE